MNNTSPGESICGPAAESKDAVGDISGSVATIRINRSRDAEKSSASEIDQPSQRLKQTPKDFEWGEALGEGSYSRVLRATQKSDRQHFAIKVVEKALVIREKKEKYVAREKEALLLCRHPMVVRLHSTFQDGTRLYFVMELCKRELFQLMQETGPLGEACGAFFAAELVDVLSFIHSKNVIHRDFKPENVLLSESGHIKLTDFGSSRIVKPGEGRTKSFCGTAEYVSPEMLENQGACQSSDLWALGCMVFQMFAARVPFRGGSEYLTFQKILHLEYEFPEVFPDPARRFVEALLVLDPARRLGADAEGLATRYDAVRAHPLFAAIRWTDPPLHQQTPPPVTPLLPLDGGGGGAAAAARA